MLAGAPLAAELRERVRAEAAAFKERHGFAPELAAVMVGHQAASSVYVQQILKS